MLKSITLTHIPRDGFRAHIPDPDILLKKLHEAIRTAGPHDKGLWGAALNNLLSLADSAGPGRANERLCTQLKYEMDPRFVDSEAIRRSLSKSLRKG